MSVKKVDFKPKPNEKVINFLREALKDAKLGRVQAVGLALACNNDGRWETETVLSCTDEWAHTLAAAVNGMAFRLNYERYSGGDFLPEPKLTDEDE